MSALNKNNSGQSCYIFCTKTSTQVPAVKRIMQEARELANDPSTDYAAWPLEEWHCTLRGPPGTEFEGGLYHLRILLPAEYPFRPPSLMLLTPNGRFELNTKICISFTNYHEELWQPAWGVRTAIIGLQGFFPLKGQAAAGVGSIENPPSERRRLAQLSRQWVCPHCQQSNLEILPDPPSTSDSPDVTPPEPTIVRETPPEAPPAPEEPVEDENQVEPPSVDPTPPSSGAVQPQQDLAPELPAESPPPNTSQQSRGRIQVPVSPSRRPPLILDTAIGFLLVLVFALLCRKMI
ncbi:ubiquitin-conjugating enzyme/RWD-like protein [Mucidula mucida]|nr:ubiquitin-conjugating enzyme/RWD-like protein [Mucidula mucida]